VTILIPAGTLVQIARLVPGRHGLTWGIATITMLRAIAGRHIFLRCGLVMKRKHQMGGLLELAMISCWDTDYVLVG
jgi:hypothetical protein